MCSPVLHLFFKYLLFYRFGRRATALFVYFITGAVTLIVGIVQYIGKDRKLNCFPPVKLVS